VADLPAAWNERYRDLLGVSVPDDAQGCLQDIHWSQGAMGYFPTYTLGTLYAAQFFEQAAQDLNGLEAQIREGDFEPLVSWLERNIHSQGKRYRSEALCEAVTGRGVETAPLLEHLRRKFEPLYDVAL
jgi:carboxypeptidase Taq